MTKQTFLKNLFQWGTLAAIVAVALPDMAIASSIGGSLNDFRTSDIANVPPMVNAIAFTGGAVLGVSGALKLKAHAENPAQEKLAPGVARLLAGGGLAALPYVVGTAADTLHLSGDMTYNAINTVSG